MRIATWNACKTATRKLPSGLSALGADFAVLQEVRRPALASPGFTWFGDNPRIGLAAFASRPWSIEAIEPAPGLPWSILPFRVSGPEAFNALLVWTRKEHEYLLGLNDALTAYSEFLATGPCVVLGDFNSNAAWDNPRLPTDFSRVSLRLANEFGLRSAYHTWFREPFGSETQATHYFWRQKARPFHIDFCFIPESWLSKVRTVSVRDEPPWSDLSDHRPLIIDLDLGGV